MKPIIIIVVVWLLYGLIAAGFDNAYFQRKWPELCNGQEDLGRALIVVPFGAIGLPIIFLSTGFGKYGWSLSPTANPRCDR